MTDPRKDDHDPAQNRFERVQIIPLGGLGEVGMNCMAIAYGDDVVIVDCGVTFPEGEGFGVNLILPDFSWILENKERVRGVVITHGHEDHIGALPFLLRELDVPVYAPRMALGLIKHKLEEHKLQERRTLFEISEEDEVDLGEMSAEFIHVNHSMPDCLAVALRTPVGTLVHTGDWRVDYTPIAGKAIDTARFAELGDEGVLALLGDSTNIHSTGVAKSESVVARGLETEVRKAKGMAVVTLFSSNIHRFQALLDIAHRVGRRVFVNGRSIQNSTRIAQELGVLKLPSNDILIHEAREIDFMDRDKVLMVCTGSQGETRAGLSRIANDDHASLHLEEGDTVIFSARIVPGNERLVYKLINTLCEKGVHVVTPREAPVHTTGHAYQDEIKMMIQLVRPKHLIPVHGEYSMLQKHSQVGEAMGIENTHLLTNGKVLEISERGAKMLDPVKSGRTSVGSELEILSDRVVRERRKVSYAGVIVVVVAVDAELGEVVSGPHITCQGVYFEGLEDDVLESARMSVMQTLEGLDPDMLGDLGLVSEKLRMATRRFFRRRFNQRPVIVPIVTD